MGVEMGIEFLPTEKLNWLQHYNNASLGLAMTYLNLGNNDKLGSALAAYPYLNIPLVNKKHFRLTLKPGAGISLLNKRYANTNIDPNGNKLPITDKENPTNIANSAIGSVLNSYFAGHVGIEFPIKKGFAINASGGWNHISNGSTVAPNAGLNMLTAQIGLSYTPQHHTYTYPKKIRNRTTDKKWTFEINAAGGVRDLYYRDNTLYGIASLSAGAHYRIAHIFRLGIGTDGFYDGAYGAVYKDFAQEGDNVTHYAKTYISSNELRNKFRVGISLQPEFVLGRFIAGFHFGVYLYDPIKNLEPFQAVKENGGKPLDKGIFYKYGSTTIEDGWLYTCAVGKYLINEHFFVSIALKTHLQKAEFIAWGVGVTF